MPLLKDKTKKLKLFYPIFLSLPIINLHNHIYIVLLASVKFHALHLTLMDELVNVEVVVVNHNSGQRLDERSVD